MNLKNKLKELFILLNGHSSSFSSYDPEFNKIQIQISEEIFKHTNLSDFFKIDDKGAIVSDKMNILIAEDFVGVSIIDEKIVNLYMDALSLEQIVDFLNKLSSNYEEIIKLKTIKQLF